MPNRSIRDERDTTTRAGAPGKGSLLGKTKPAAADPAPTEDLSVLGASDKLRARKAQIDQAVDDAS